MLTAFVKPAALTLALTFAFLASAQQRPPHDPFPEINLAAQSLSGKAALEALGVHLPAVAQHYGLTVTELQHLLLTDHTARIDRHGLLFYADDLPFTPRVFFGDGTLSNNPSAASIPDAVTFQLHSRPGARGILFINHQGELVTGSSWNSNSPIDAQPYSRDADAGISPQELQDIKTHWLSVAEDYAPFNVDVTTERPTTIDPMHFIEIIVTPTNAWYGNGSGGVCYNGSFTWGLGVGHQVCWVFSALLNNNVKYIKEAISHESGHAFGLNHWSSFEPDGGTFLATYYAGAVTWAPIMGNSYYVPVTTWSQGEYPGAGVFTYGGAQDDHAIIRATVGLALPDEAPGTLASTATLVPMSSTGLVSVDYRGVISIQGDIDVFRLQTQAGALSLDVAPSLGQGDLDFRVRLYDSSATIQFESDPAAVATVHLALPSLAAGTYFLEIAPVGFAGPLDGGYSNYGSAGAYQVVGTYVAAPSSTIDAGQPVDAGTPPIDAGQPAVDAGRDAGAPDAGAITADAGRDAGFTTDAGTDAGPSSADAGRDAGSTTPDAGLDAGRSDAGTNDAGTNDAGTGTDAGIVIDDAGVDAGNSAVDAGELDAGGLATDAGSTPDDAGQSTPDSGSALTDAGTGPDGGSVDLDGPVIGGCGCSGASSHGFAWPGLLLLVLMTRRRSR